MNDAIELNGEVSVSLSSEYGYDVGEINVISPSNIRNKIKYYTENFDDQLRMIGRPSVRVLDAQITTERRTFERKFAICDNCNERTEVYDHPRKYGYLGMPYIDCPRCGGKAYMEDEEGIVVDENNIKFPDHFYKFGSDKDSIEIGDEELTVWAKRALKRIKETKGSDFYIEATGDSCCIGLNFEDEITVIICKGYYEFSFDK